MFRPQQVKVFDPHNPEYALVDSIESELFEYLSPEILWWSLNEQASKDNQTEIEEIYGEESVGHDSTGVLTFDGPFKVSIRAEINPIVQELTKLGVEQLEEMEFTCNIAAMNEYLQSRAPKAGDIFRLSYIERNTSQKRYIWYVISTITPVDLYNFRYVNYQINAEQTTLNNVPENIKNYI